MVTNLGQIFRTNIGEGNARIRQVGYTHVVASEKKANWLYHQSIELSVMIDCDVVFISACLSR
jgi:hypothetical protein